MPATYILKLFPYTCMGRLKKLLTMSRDFAAAICITLVEVVRDLYCSLRTVVDYIVACSFKFRDRACPEIALKI